MCRLESLRCSELLVKRLLRLNLKFQSDHTTMTFENVYQSGKVVFKLWFTPGLNTDDKLLLNPRAEQLLHAMDLIVIMYTSNLNIV